MYGNLRWSGATYQSPEPFSASLRRFVGSVYSPGTTGAAETEKAAQAAQARRRDAGFMP